jgi:methylmalonyl-CoA mutase
MTAEVEIYRPKHNIRMITATALFDGHDASINIIRRILQNTGVEVIHLGHNRSVSDVVDAAIAEDAQGIAISSYQGGHIEYFKYMVDLLRGKKSSHIKVFGGGGGVIVPEEIRELEAYGVARIYSPEDGASMGLQGMINHMVKNVDFSTVKDNFDLSKLSSDNVVMIANLITSIEQAKPRGNRQLAGLKSWLAKNKDKHKTVVIGITGTGGSGKSSLTDELILRILHDLTKVRVAILSCDPSRRKTGGALLGDRIRMNAISTPRVYMRSFATRRSNAEITDALPESIDVVKAAGFDLVIVETAGIGQGDSKITDLVDVSIYVMTSEFGAASQLEKIDMLDYADLVVVNKYEKMGGEDAVRDVRKQIQRNQNAWDKLPEDMPVFGTIASRFNDDGVTALYHSILKTIADKTDIKFNSGLKKPKTKTSSSKTIIIPTERTRYLSEIADTVRMYRSKTIEQADTLRKVWHLEETSKKISADKPDQDTSKLVSRLKKEVSKTKKMLGKDTVKQINEWEKIKKVYSKDEFVYHVRNHEFRVPLFF